MSETTHRRSRGAPSAGFLRRVLAEVEFVGEKLDERDHSWARHTLAELEDLLLDEIRRADSRSKPRTHRRHAKA